MDGPARREGRAGGRRASAVSFLTTDSNDVVRPVHAKAMPVMLTGTAADLWLSADTPTAVTLQAPFPADQMQVVASREREDRGAAAFAICTS